MDMINKKYHNIHHSFIIFQFHNYVAALHMSCFSYNLLPLKILQMSFVTNGQPMAIHGNHHLNLVPHFMLIAPILFFNLSYKLCLFKVNKLCHSVWMPTTVYHSELQTLLLRPTANTPVQRKFTPR